MRLNVCYCPQSGWGRRLRTTLKRVRFLAASETRLQRLCMSPISTACASSATARSLSSVYQQTAERDRLKRCDFYTFVTVRDGSIGGDQGCAIEGSDWRIRGISSA